MIFSRADVPSESVTKNALRRVASNSDGTGVDTDFSKHFFGDWSRTTKPTKRFFTKSSMRSNDSFLL